MGSSVRHMKAIKPILVSLWECCPKVFTEVRGPEGDADTRLKKTPKPQKPITKTKMPAEEVPFEDASNDKVQADKKEVDKEPKRVKTRREPAKKRARKKKALEDEGSLKDGIVIGARFEADPNVLLAGYWGKKVHTIPLPLCMVAVCVACEETCCLLIIHSPLIIHASPCIRHGHM